VKGWLDEMDEEACTLGHARVTGFFFNQFVHFMERVFLETKKKNETAINVNLLKANSKSIR